MARKTPAAAPADVQSIPDMPTYRREVFYSIMIPGCNDRVAIEYAITALKNSHVADNLIFTHLPTTDEHGEPLPGHVSVPRLFTFWQGDETEHAWQKSIRDKIPHAIIDVKDWTPAPGYPQGDVSL